ncbi:probable carotenoid cleavage dioxygenase 4, chloroplastic [Salvia splendens]|uniref:probable carotenoid cleavage dioxygenase 4, chloroplastic n=1 Tax=Salvia splendens TaxID=180675 RepID=UPI001C2688F8|nr:probable carotenoid cleavage dioxygenase 4, chloroplastic [Salvia splendens]
MEIIWLRRLLTEIGFSPKRKSQLFCDNKAAISISENPVHHDRTKHVEVDRHSIKENLEAGVIEFPFVKSEDQLADILTKAVHHKQPLPLSITIFTETVERRQLSEKALDFAVINPAYAAKENRDPDNLTAAEDDGYLVTYVHDDNAQESMFLVMDAKSSTLDIVAAVKLPQRVPGAFHCLFLSELELRMASS